VKKKGKGKKNRKNKKMPPTELEAKGKVKIS
jgi:hypothetical protein